jgi:hypothetical protein
MVDWVLMPTSQGGHAAVRGARLRALAGYVAQRDNLEEPSTTGGLSSHLAPLISPHTHSNAWSSQGFDQLFNILKLWSSSESANAQGPRCRLPRKAAGYARSSLSAPDAADQTTRWCSTPAANCES